MLNLQQTTLHLDKLSDLEISYLSTLFPSRVETPPPDKSHFLDLPRQLRDRVYYFAAVDFWELLRPSTRKNLDHALHHSKANQLARGLSLRMVSKQIGSEFEDMVYGPEMIRGCYTESPTLLDGVPQPKPPQTMSAAMVKSVLQSKCLFRWRPGRFVLGKWQSSPGWFILEAPKGDSITPGVHEECHFAQDYKDAYGDIAFVGHMELVVFKSDLYTYKIGPALGFRDQVWKFGSKDETFSCLVKGVTDFRGLGRSSTI